MLREEMEIHELYAKCCVLIKLIHGDIDSRDKDVLAYIAEEYLSRLGETIGISDK